MILGHNGTVIIIVKLKHTKRPVKVVLKFIVQTIDVLGSDERSESMADITIRDLIIYYTAQADAFKFASTYVKSPNVSKKLLELSETYSDRAFTLSEICRFVGKSATTELNLLDNYEANLHIEKENFKKRYGYER